MGMSAETALALAKAYTKATMQGAGAVQGNDGADGFSPEAVVERNAADDGVIVTITDATGTKTAELKDGQPGQKGDPGDKGDPGEGVPAGGTAGQILVKNSGTDFDTQWKTLQQGGGNGGVAGVESFNGRAGAVMPQAGDYTPGMIGADPAGASNTALNDANAYTDVKAGESALYADNKAVEAMAYTDTKMAEANRYTDQKVADLVGTAPQTLDTLQEVAEALEQNKDVTDALNQAIGERAKQADMEAHTQDTDIHITAEEREKWDEKQDALTGTKGHVLGFDDDGNPEPQELPVQTIDTVPVKDSKNPVQSGGVYAELENTVKYDGDRNVQFEKLVVLDTNQKLLGKTPDDNDNHVLLATMAWNVGTPDEYIQNEVGSDHVHLNFNSKGRPTVELPGGVKKEIAYLDEAGGSDTYEIITCDIADITEGLSEFTVSNISKTFAEIYVNITNSKDVILKANYVAENYVYMLHPSTVNNAMIAFSTATNDKALTITIKNDNSLTGEIVSAGKTVTPDAVRVTCKITKDDTYGVKIMVSDASSDLPGLIKDIQDNKAIYLMDTNYGYMFTPAYVDSSRIDFTSTIKSTGDNGTEVVEKYTVTLDDQGNASGTVEKLRIKAAVEITESDNTLSGAITAKDACAIIDLVNQGSYVHLKDQNSYIYNVIKPNGTTTADFYRETDGKKYKITVHRNGRIIGKITEADAAPTEDSTNPVQSGGVYTALEGKQDKITGTENQMVAIGADGNATVIDGSVIDNIEYTPSTADGGNNVLKINLANGISQSFNIKNGSKGNKGDTGPAGANGTTPTIKAAAGANIGTVGTPSVSASTSGTTTTFTFNNLKGATGAAGAKGATGTRGSRWSTGTAITGTSTTATVFSGTGITDALVNDMYLNTSTGNVYRCTTAGNASTAKWVYAGCIKGASATSAIADVAWRSVDTSVKNSNLSVQRASYCVRNGICYVTGAVTAADAVNSTQSVGLVPKCGTTIYAPVAYDTPNSFGTPFVQVSDTGYLSIGYPAVGETMFFNFSYPVASL